MAPKMNQAAAHLAIRRARLALYGTIGLCGVTSYQSFRAQNTLESAAKENNRQRWKEGLKQRDYLQTHYVCSRKNLDEGRYYTLISSSWNHGSMIHLLFNMLGLWSFGRTIAYSFGAGTFMTLFYGGSIVGNALCLALDKRYGSGDQDPMGMRAKPKNEAAGFIGASGGVCAVLAANACLNPWGSMIIGIAFIPVPVPNIIGTLGFAGFSVWAQNNSFQNNVAHFGHLGGLLHGFIWFVARFRGLPMVRFRR